VTRSSEHHHVQDLLGAYALHALEAHERDAVERHLSECVICRAEVDAHLEIAAALGQGVETAPPELWGRIVEGLEERSPVVSPLEVATASSMGRLRLRTRASRLAAIGAVAAAVAAICVLGVSLANTDQQLDHARQALGSSAAAFQHALTVPGHRTAPLRSLSGKAIARVVVDPGGHGYLFALKMPVLPASRTYQLWAIVRGQAISIGLLGRHPAAAAFEVGSARAIQVAVTIEPAAGSQTPTSSVIAVGTL
jgi:anti-sigma-K factor RskA